MKMEMSYRDKVILIVLLIILVLVGGFFALIKPKYQAWKESKTLYATTKTEWDGIEQKKNQIPILQDGIKKDYNDYKKIAQIFVNDAFKSANETWRNEKTSYEIDQYLQPSIDECSLEVDNMALQDVKEETIEYYFCEPDVLTYSLLEAADVNGNYNAEVAKVMKEATVLSQREVAEVMCQPVELTVTTNKENLLMFLDKLSEEKNAVLIEAVSVDNYQFNDGLESTVTGPDGQVMTVVQEAADGNGTSSVTINIAFYNAKPIDEPNLGEIA